MAVAGGCMVAHGKTDHYRPGQSPYQAAGAGTAMRARRPPNLAPAIHGIAEDLPLDDQSVDASMALVIVHQWANLRKGLSELCRVTRDPVLILTFDREALDRYWLAHHVPELIAVEYRRYPPLQTVCSQLRGAVQIHTVPIPIDCLDGFTEAFYAHLERFLDPNFRKAQSAWGFVDKEVEECYGEWRDKPFYKGSLRLIISGPAAGNSF
jgi:ubiquinone/menaquinone biosynthesis C-methylase UbiE